MYSLSNDIRSRKFYFLYQTVLYLYKACKFHQNFLFKIIVHANKYHNDDLGLLRYDTMSIASQHFEALKLQKTLIQ